MKIEKQALIEIVKTEVEMVSKSRWFTAREKQLKIMELNTLINQDQFTNNKNK
jgi:hypothetical protein